MKIQSAFIVLLVFATIPLHLGMGRHGQYDEEARETERREKSFRKQEVHERKNPVTRFAQGVKQSTVDSATGVLGQTVESTREDAPVIGTVEGVRKGSEKLLDNTVRGAVKVATLGMGEVSNYEVIEPEHGKDDTTKIRLKF